MRFLHYWHIRAASKRTAVSQPVAIDMQTLDTIPVAKYSITRRICCFLTSYIIYDAGYGYFQT